MRSGFRGKNSVKIKTQKLRFVITVTERSFIFYHFSQPNSTLTGTSKISIRTKIVSSLAELSAVSIFARVDLSIPILSARDCWVYPYIFLRYLIFSPRIICLCLYFFFIASPEKIKSAQPKSRTKNVTLGLMRLKQLPFSIKRNSKVEPTFLTNVNYFFSMENTFLLNCLSRKAILSQHKTKSKFPEPAISMVSIFAQKRKKSRIFQCGIPWSTSANSQNTCDLNSFYVLNLN